MMKDLDAQGVWIHRVPTRIEIWRGISLIGVLYMLVRLFTYLCDDHVPVYGYVISYCNHVYTHVTELMIDDKFIEVSV